VDASRHAAGLAFQRWADWVHSYILWYVPQYVGMHPHILRYPSMRGCITIYLDTQVYGGASPYTGVPQYIWMHPHILGYPSIRVPQHVGMHPHVLGYPSIWGCTQSSHPCEECVRPRSKTIGLELQARPPTVRGGGPGASDPRPIGGAISDAGPGEVGGPTRSTACPVDAAPVQGRVVGSHGCLSPGPALGASVSKVGPGEGAAGHPVVEQFARSHW
jgi:hypothetical protein